MAGCLFAVSASTSVTIAPVLSQLSTSRPLRGAGAGNGSPSVTYTGRLGAGMTTDSSPE